MKDLFKRHPELLLCEDSIKMALDALIAAYETGGKLLLCGNGGSAADCDHVVGELMKGFLLKRELTDGKKAELKAANPNIGDELLQKLQRGLPAISLPSICGLNSAFANDVCPDMIYAQSLLSLAVRGDVLIAISTSGNSKNVILAAELAKSIGVTVIALTGEGGGKLGEIADITVGVPERETFRVQELHLPVYHYLCAMIEEHFFG